MCTKCNEKCIKIWQQIVEPVNLLTIILNVLMFCFAAVIMFWFIVSDQILRLLTDKINIIILMAKYNKKVENDIMFLINNTNIDIEYVNNIHGNRTEKNYENLKEQIFPVFYVLFGLLFIVSVYILYKKIVLSYYDKIIILLSFISGLPDFIFLITVGIRWKFLGDTTIYSLIIDHYIQSRITSIQNNDDGIENMDGRNVTDNIIKNNRERIIETLQDVKDNINSTIIVLNKREEELISEINMCSVAYIIILIFISYTLGIYFIRKSDSSCLEILPTIITCFIINILVLGFIILMREYAYTFMYITKDEISLFIINMLNLQK